MKNFSFNEGHITIELSTIKLDYCIKFLAQSYLKS